MFYSGGISKSGFNKAGIKNLFLFSKMQEKSSDKDQGRAGKN